MAVDVPLDAASAPMGRFGKPEEIVEAAAWPVGGRLIT
jgi:NAD(P)-dependent dehydrogenase (short-subunit alcohol dehydrogenase family)